LQKTNDVELAFIASEKYYAFRGRLMSPSVCDLWVSSRLLGLCVNARPTKNI